MFHSHDRKLNQSSMDFDFAIHTSNIAIVSVLRSIESKTLLAAITSASSFARGKIMDVLSERAREILEEDLEKLGPIPEEEQVEARHRMILLFAVTMDHLPHHNSNNMN